jgi:RHS repeat-associated protein
MAGELTAVRENGATSGVGVLATYAYDNLGRRTGITRSDGVSTAYGYDAISRLTSLAHSGSSNDQSYTLTYNPANQILSRTASNDNYAWDKAANINHAYLVNGLNQYTNVGGVAYGYYSSGDLGSGPQTFTYDSQKRLLTTSGSPTTTFNYDPLGRLYEVAGSATTFFLYDGDQIVGEHNGSAFVRYYVPSDVEDRPVLWYEGGDRRWLLDDERGSVIAAANASASVLFTNSYDEYGQPGSSNQGRFQYTGQAWIPEAGLYSYKARAYLPAIGRFLQTDPIGYGGGTNIYAYAGLDPVNGSDPSGLVSDQEQPEADGGGGIDGTGGGIMAGVGAGADFADSAGSPLLGSIQEDRMLDNLTVRLANRIGQAGQQAIDTFVGEAEEEEEEPAEGELRDPETEPGYVPPTPEALAARQITNLAEAAQRGWGLNPDQFVYGELLPGSVLYRAGSAYGTWYTDATTINRVGQGAGYGNLLQMGYEPKEIDAYEVVIRAPAAEGVAIANPKLGNGGATQYFIPNASQYLRMLPGSIRPGR